MNKRNTALLAVITAALVALTAVSVSVSENFSADSTDEAVWQASYMASSQSPRTEDELYHAWTTSALVLEGVSTGYSNVPSVPAIVDEFVYVRINGTMYKLDIYTGESLASAASLSGNQLYGHWVDYADHNGGLVLDGLNSTALDADLNVLYKFPQQHLKFVYHDGLLYGVDRTGVSVYTPTDDDPSVADEVKTAVLRITFDSAWSAATIPQYPVIVGDVLYIAISTNSSTKIDSYSLNTGELLDSYALNEPSINSAPTYMNGVLYITTYSSGVFGGGTQYDVAYAIPVNAGNMDADNVKTFTMTSQRTNSSLIPYSTGIGFIKTPEAFHVLDLETFTEIAVVDTSSRASAWGGSRGGMSMTDGYFESDGKFYGYSIPYSNIKTIIIYCYDVATNTASYAEYSLPTISTQYNTENVYFGKDGQIIWHNDAGDLFCFVPPMNSDYKLNGSSVTVTMNLFDGNGDVYVSIYVAFDDGSFMRVVSKLAYNGSKASFTVTFSGNGTATGYMVSVYDGNPSYGSDVVLTRTTGNIAI